MVVIEHTVPFFLPIRQAENELLSTNAMMSLGAQTIGFICLLCLLKFFIFWFQKFIDHVGDLLQAYVDRREQVHLFSFNYASRFLIYCLKKMYMKVVRAFRCYYSTTFNFLFSIPNTFF